MNVKDARTVGSHYIYLPQGDGFPCKVGVCECGPANAFTGPQFVSLNDMQAIREWEARHK